MRLHDGDCMAWRYYGRIVDDHSRSATKDNLQTLTRLCRPCVVECYPGLFVVPVPLPLPLVDFPPGLLSGFTEKRRTKLGEELLAHCDES